ncbi:MAG TPA: hypothetical protein EYP10_15320, partial [Armatimonadetes bacterium]|nr:hypothetical protein [Armatimonadota bacterium]
RAIAYDAVQGGNRDVFIATLEILRPQVKILFPTPNVRLEGTVAIRATIQVPYGKLSRMSLEYGHGEKPQVWRAIPLKVAEPVKDAVIAEWDTSELSGILTLRLTAWDEENDSSEALVTVSAERTYGVSFVEHSVPPEMLAGDTVPVTLKLRNIGTMTWLPTGRYAVTLTYRWRDSSGAIVFQGPDTRLPRPVNNSEEVTINTNLQAPRIPGSYTVEWDLQHGGAVWFSDEGCEVLRVNVRVVWRYAAQVLSHNAPKEMAPSQVYTVRVRLRNIGTSPWNGEGATEKLFIGYHWLDKQGVLLDEQPILTKIEVPVKPGESAEVNARVRAPDVPGEYSLAWDMAVEGPEERILWLSEQGNAFPQVPIVVRVPYAVAYLNHTTPTTMMPGQIYLASLRLRNTGALTWESRGLRAVHIGYKWLDSKGKELPAPLLTTLLPYDVAPGEIVEVAARVQAPSRAGDYILQWDLVRGGNLWFSRMGSPPLRVEVMVQRPIYGVEFQPREHPTRMIAGHELNVQMQLTNRGTLTWSAAGERAVTLSYHWLDSDGKELLDEQPFKTPLPHDVSLGGTVTLNARVRAPRRPGQWTLRWDLHMAGIGWFSEQGAAFLNVPVTVVPEYDYSVISHDTPTELVAGQTYTVHLRIRNRSAFIWRASGEDMVQLGYKWLDEQGEVVELGGLATIPRDTEPDDVLEMEALLRAPKRPGTYTLKWDMVRQGKIWFEEQGVRALTLQVRVK